MQVIFRTRVVKAELGNRSGCEVKPEVGAPVKQNLTGSVSCAPAGC